MTEEKITIPIKIKKENIIIDNNGNLSLKASPELFKDVFEMYGIDLTNQNLLETISRKNFEILIKSI